MRDARHFRRLPLAATCVRTLWIQSDTEHACNAIGKFAAVPKGCNYSRVERGQFLLSNVCALNLSGPRRRRHCRIHCTHWQRTNVTRAAQAAGDAFVFYVIHCAALCMFKQCVCARLPPWALSGCHASPIPRYPGQDEAWRTRSVSGSRGAHSRTSFHRFSI